MELWHIILLALIQALTEFLPVSSSGHLGLFGFFLGMPYQGVTFDLALHLGTLLAVLFYFRREVLVLIRGTLAIRPGRALDDTQRLAVGLALTTIPAVIVGLAMGESLADKLRHPLLIAVNLIVFGLLLWAAERWSRADKREHDVTLRHAVLIGLAQALALIPGTSRSGVTMTAAMGLGLTREAAARYSFLMSIPVTAMAVAYGALQLARHPHHWSAQEMLLGAGISGVAGVLVIHFLLAVVRRVGTGPFVIYRLAMGAFVIAWYYWHR